MTTEKMKEEPFYSFKHYDTRREIDYVINVDERGHYTKEAIEQTLEPEDYADEDLKNYDKWAALLLYYCSMIAEEQAIFRVDIDYHGDSLSASIVCKLEHMEVDSMELPGDLFNDICKYFRLLNFSAGKVGDTFAIGMEVDN